ncbi:hypothetical protein PIB30_092389 [Stylosanthes scabra]|uniref:Uncharacterized protein n=1 Tax=Stylosanthes scabra TaxID=79078 RepID=A0ABU6VVR7_9FABA|nr:hypothetical protein [Stylosanthes scabra]
MRLFMITSETDAKVTGSSPTLQDPQRECGKYPKRGMGHFGVSAIFARKEPCLGFIPNSRRVREDNQRVSSRPALGTLGMHLNGLGEGRFEEEKEEEPRIERRRERMRRYHFDDEPFIHPLHSIRFDPDCPYELPIDSLLALRCRDLSKKKDPSPQESGPS